MPARDSPTVAAIYGLPSGPPKRTRICAAFSRRWSPMSDRLATDESDTRGDVWRPVWTDRDDDRSDWNGWESCFTDVTAYERWIGEVATLIVNELQLGPSDIVADLGCGTGRVAA